MIKYLFGICVLAITLPGCEGFFSATKEIDLSEFENQISVVGRLVNTDLDLVEDFDLLNNLGVLVARSKSVVDTSQFKLIENADVMLTGSDGLDVNLTFNEKSGYYMPTDAATGEFDRIVVNENTKYDLVVDVPGEPTIEATCETKSFGKILNVEIIKDDIRGEEGYTIDKIKIEIDDPLDENYYHLSVFYQQLESQNGEEYLYPDQGYVFNFGSIGSSTPELITDELFNGKTETLEYWSERYENDRATIQEAVVFIRSLSKEEYEFRRSVQANRDAEDNPFAEPSVIFSNIENGLGVFTMSRVERFVIPWE